MGKIYIGTDKISGVKIVSPPVNTADATITEADVLASKIAYGPNGKVTGTLEVSQYYTGVQEPAESLGEPGDLYFLVEE